MFRNFFTLATQAILIANFSGSGPYQVTTVSSDLSVSNGQALEYTTFMPEDSQASVHVLLVHAFSRDMSVLSDFAQHYAGWGIPVVTMNLNHSSIFENDPLQDVIDLGLLSSYISEGEPIIYVGHSAGAMKAIASAVSDTNAIAVLGLDLTDGAYEQTGGDFLALSNVPELSIPLWGLLGEPSDCNANGNGLDVYFESNYANAISITEADHCDFESPTNFLCTLLCQGSNDIFSDDDINDVILNLSTAYLLHHSGMQDDAISMWMPGNDYYEGLISVGAIEQLTELEISSGISLPNKITLYPNYPNPFNPLTNITYDIQSNAHVKVNIANVKGDHIRHLINEYQFSGNHSALWNGKDDNGHSVPSGIYFYTMTANKYSKSNKMTIVK
tara:strand:+ start:4633 stop:5793 length:1161 start_codon:yes stop_codon:yes gene_type:complete